MCLNVPGSTAWPGPSGFCKMLLMPQQRRARTPQTNNGSSSSLNILDVVSFSSLPCVRGDQLLRGAALNAVLIAEAKLRWENDNESGAKSWVAFLLMNDVTELLMDQHSRLGFLTLRWGVVRRWTRFFFGIYLMRVIFMEMDDTWRLLELPNCKMFCLIAAYNAYN